MLCNVTNTAYRLRFSDLFFREVERIVTENTNRGSSSIVRQTADWITYLLRFIQSMGNLNDTAHYRYVLGHIEYDTTSYENGLGIFTFNVYYDEEIHNIIVSIEDVSWNFSSKRFYNLMTEEIRTRNKIIIRESQLRKIIKETIRNYLRT